MVEKNAGREGRELSCEEFRREVEKLHVEKECLQRELGKENPMNTGLFPGATSSPVFSSSWPP
ncbi:MAG: hypothetical protein SWK76_13870 [Actinomycetota bacterium]|nr:hypothetical protein [Actinomycetota bacterium]